MRHFILSSFFLFLLVSTGAQTVDVYQRPVQHERSRDFDVLHYRIALDVDMDDKMLKGENTVTLMPLNDGLETVVLDAVSLVVTEVVDRSGVPLNFNQTGDQLTISLPGARSHRDTVIFTIRYDLKEQVLGLRFMDATAHSPRQVSSDCFPDKARQWIPCYDYPHDKITQEMIVTVDSGYKVLSNGTLIETRENRPEGKRTYHWKQSLPHSTYLINLSIADYAVVQDSLGSLPVNYWVYPSNVEDAKRSFEKTPSMIDFFNHLYGYDYPWEKYDQVISAYMGGGAEATSATLLGEGAVTDRRGALDFSFEGIIAHEIAHQWWGDLVTLRSWEHTWMNESFATYSDYLYKVHAWDSNEAAYDLVRKKNQYLIEAHTRYMRPVVFNRYESPGQNFDSHTYPKGACILHMLRSIIGDDPFFRVLSTFLHRHEFQPVTTQDFMKCVKDVTGKNMDWFFEQFLFYPGHPYFEVTKTWNETAKTLTVKIIQTQERWDKVPIYKIPVNIGLYSAREKRIEELWLDEKTGIFEFKLDEEPLLVRFDDGNYLLKEWTFKKPEEELIYQARNDDMTGRLWAVNELSTYRESRKTMETWSEVALKDSFWAVREAAIRQLAALENNQFNTLFYSALQDPKSNVRAAALVALAGSGEKDIISLCSKVYETDESYLVMAEALKVIGKYGDSSQLEFLGEAQKMESPRNVVGRAAGEAIEMINQATHGFNPQQQPAGRNKPNILFLLADDLGYGELGSYGQKEIKTPVLDELANQGMRFTDFYAGSCVCSPSRAVLMTGRPSAISTIRGNTGYFPSSGRFDRVALEKNEITLGEMLRGAGYQTAFVGKWHLDDPRDLSTWAYNRGFDFAVQEQWGTGPGGIPYDEEMHWINGKQDSVYYNENEYDCKDEFRTNIAIEYLENTDRDRPFFLFMSYRAPHAHERYIRNKELYAGKGWPEKERMHAAKITLLDRQIGRILEKLEEMGELDNTLVIFTSDNGPHAELDHDHEFFDSNGALKGLKRDTYEGGIRVPAIAFWKGKIKSGTVSGYQGSGQDFMPTFAEAAGIGPPGQTSGVSFIPVLTGKSPHPREFLNWEFHKYGTKESDFRQSVRLGNMKGVRYGVHSKTELYNLENDLSETRDIADQHPELVERMEQIFREERALNEHYPYGGTSSLAISQVDENVTREVENKKNGVGEPADVMDLHLNFNSDWRFHLGEVPGFYHPDFDDTGWCVLDVPHDWSIEGQFAEENPAGVSGGYLPTGIGCYRKNFTLPEGTEGKRVKIRFDGVYMNSSVYLNGSYLGNRPYGFSTFEYDLTPHLKYNGNINIIAVNVDHSLPGTSRWYTGSGINRNVHLIITEQQHFQSFSTFFRTTSVEDGIARMKVDCKVISNNYPESDRVSFQPFPEDWNKVIKKARIAVVLKDRKGGILAETVDTFALGDFTTITPSFELEGRDPVLWSDKNPYLYTLELQLWIEDRMVDSEAHRVGIRTIEFNKEQGMLVNGKKVVARGVCLHKDAGSFGTAVPKDVWRFRLEKLKKMGCNAIRTHGPVDPVFIDVCDEQGFYLMAEAFDEWNKRWHYGYSEDPAGKKDNTYHKFFNQWAETDLKDMIRRDRNHPSVFMYSVGNEVPDQRYTEGPETLEMLMAWAKEEDDTRPVTATCDWAPWANASGFLDSMDIAGYNYPDRYFEEHYREEHSRYPDRILLGAENYLTLKNWLAVRDNPYVVGLFLWVGIDYLGESLGWPRRGWEWGLIDIGGFEKTLYYYWQAFWSEEPMVHIAVNLKEKDPFRWRCYDVASHWNFGPGEVDTVFVYSNTEMVKLFQNGRSLGTKDVDPDTYQAVYLVDYKKGELTAYAFNKGKRVATHTLRTSGEPEKLELHYAREPEGDEKDRLIFLTLEIQDKKGVRCPSASDEVIVDVRGPGELIGLDSGNQFSHELYKQDRRKAHEGRLLLTIRPKGDGVISVQCRAGDLEPCTMTIQNE